MQRASSLFPSGRPMTSVAVEFGSTLTTAMNLVKLDIDCVVFH